ncbi:MAG: fumarate hydratase [Bacillota bacterium]
MLERAMEAEESPVGREVVKQVLENHRIAREEGVPACQDTGVAMAFLEKSGRTFISLGATCTRPSTRG